MSARAEVHAARVQILNAEQTQSIADAAMAAYVGDLGPAAAWLKRIGCYVTGREGGRQVDWAGGPGVPAGAVVTGGDPVSSCIQLLFATLGPTWARTNGADALFAVNRRWAALAKARKAAAS